MLFPNIKSPLIEGPMTDQIVCAVCGNDNPDKFLLVTEPYFFDGRLAGNTLKGCACEVCEEKAKSR